MHNDVGGAVTKTAPEGAMRWSSGRLALSARGDLIIVNATVDPLPRLSYESLSHAVLPWPIPREEKLQSVTPAAHLHPLDIPRVFQTFDADGSGDIDVSELYVALEHLGHSLNSTNAR